MTRWVRDRIETIRERKDVERRLTETLILYRDVLEQIVSVTRSNAHICWIAAEATDLIDEALKAEELL